MIYAGAPCVGLRYWCVPLVRGNDSTMRVILVRICSSGLIVRRSIVQSNSKGS